MLNSEYIKYKNIKKQTMKRVKNFNQFLNENLNEAYNALSPDEVFNIMDAAGMFTSTANDAANIQWQSREDLINYLLSDHIPKKYHKKFLSYVTPKNESLNEVVGRASWVPKNAKKIKSIWMKEFDFEEEPYLDYMASGWFLIHEKFKNAAPVYSAPEEFFSLGLFKDVLISVHGEIDDRDFSTFNVLVAYDVDEQAFANCVQSSPMEFPTILEDMGIEKIETKSFSYSPDTKPQSVLKAAKQVVSYIKPIINLHN